MKIDINKRYLITGGAGFLGVELIARLTEMGCKNLVTVSRNEGKLIELQEKFPNVKTITGDIGNRYICEKACQGVHGIFHLAAFKHVGLAEENVRQCVTSNVLGTMNILEMTRKYQPDFIIGISTDKAAQVKGIYGATKLIQEGLFHEYQRISRHTQYRTVRYGNVLYSTGSVLCKWKEKLEKGEDIIITDPNATRFYWTVDQAVDLIFDCLDKAKDATPHHFPMKSISMGDLMEAMIKKYGTGKSKVKQIGLQKGENMHEIISDQGFDSSKAERYTMPEILAII